MLGFANPDVSGVMAYIVMAYIVMTWILGRCWGSPIRMFPESADGGTPKAVRPDAEGPLKRRASFVDTARP